MNSLESRKGKERRRYPRNYLKLKVQGEATPGNGSTTPSGFFGHTTDVSPRGISIFSAHLPEYKVGQQFKLMLQLFDGEKPIEALGRLCWLKEADRVGEEHSIHFGVELLGMAKSIRGYERWIERISWH